LISFSKISKILTLIVIILAIAAVSALVYSQFNTMKDSYNSKIKVTFVKSAAAFDYSCGTSDYQIYLVVDNTGAKNVVDLSVSITNPLCSGGIPGILPKSLNASSKMSFTAESSTENGTLTISGNNTLVQINF
jgi:hypothetical protein